ncbi:MAG: GHKL domain-containing protein [Bdellovibrionaceae bacterium]|nr:GHKL domain-containing protein [Pseudobdellovibrionaceae bacterium]
MGYFSAVVNYFLPHKMRVKPSDSLALAKLKKFRINIQFSLAGAVFVFIMFLARFLIEGNRSQTIFVLPIASMIFLVALYTGKKFSTTIPTTLVLFLSGLILLPLRIISTGGVTSSVVVWGAIMPSLFILSSNLKTALIFIFIFVVELYLISQPQILGLNINSFEVSNSVHFAVSVIGISLVTILATVQEMTRLTHERSLLEFEQKDAVNKRMASIGQMAGGIAHEINNPLTIISGSTLFIKKALQKDSIDVDFVTKNLSKIEKTTNRIHEIVESLLLYTREVDESNYEKVSLCKLVKAVVKYELENFNEKNVVVTPHGQADITASCNRIQIERVLSNLVSNAKDAVSTLEEKWIKITLMKIDGNAVISVKDSGAGIPQELAQKIMDPFVTTKDIGKGTGLGLSLSCGIMEQHNGRIEINTDSENTEFLVILPLERKA